MKENNPQFCIDFTGIGAPKAGTTLLADWLAEHPQICFAEPKEPHYFNQKSAYIHPQPNPNFDKNINWYAKHYAHAKQGQIKGEFSTGYMYDPQVAKRLFEHNPNIKILVGIRHPAERAYSQYQMFRYYFKKENLPFDQAVQQRPEFIEKSQYFKLLQAFYAVFPSKQIKIVILEDIKTRPAQICAELYDFLQIDSSFVPQSLHQKSNAAKTVKQAWVSTLMGTFTKTMVALGGAAWVEKLKKAGLKDWVIKTNSKQLNNEPMSEFARQYVLQQTLDDTENLEKLLKRDLSHWKK